MSPKGPGDRDPLNPANTYDVPASEPRFRWEGVGGETLRGLAPGLYHGVSGGPFLRSGGTCLR